MRLLYFFIFFAFCLSLCSWDIAQFTAVEEDGEEIYRTYCKSCHGKKGSLGIGGAAKLTKSEMELKDRITVISEGKGKMAPFGAILSKKEIKAVAKFTMSFSK